MGKITESMRVIDGYDIISVGKIRAKRDSFFQKL